MFSHVPTQVKSAVGFQFIALPVEILRRPDLSLGAKLLVAVVTDSARGDRRGSCRLTNAGLGARIGRSAASVKRLLSELAAAGLVRRDHVAEKHQRTAVVPTWAAQESTTGQADAAQDRPTPGSKTTHPGVHSRAAIQSRESEPIQTGPILPTPTLGGGGEDPKPSPAEVAAAMRSMIAGRFEAHMFDGVTTAAPSCSTGSPAAPAPVPAGSVEQPASSAPGKPRTAVVRSMCRQVGCSAVAGAGFVRRDRRPPCSTPRDGAELARMRAARANGPQPRGVERGPFVATGAACRDPAGISRRVVKQPPMLPASPDR